MREFDSIDNSARKNCSSGMCTGEQPRPTKDPGTMIPCGACWAHEIFLPLSHVPCRLYLLPFQVLLLLSWEMQGTIISGGLVS